MKKNRKLNNKGYMLVEIILASVIAFGLAYYMLELTIKLKNKNDDLLVETMAMTDNAIISNAIMEYLRKNTSLSQCPNGEFIIVEDDKRVFVNNKFVTEVSDYISFGNEDGEIYKCESMSGGAFHIVVYLGVSQQKNTDFNIDLYYIANNDGMIWDGIPNQPGDFLGR